MLTSLLQCSAAWGASVIDNADPTLAGIRNLAKTVKITLISGLVCDTVIAVTMVVILLRARRDLSFSHTQRLLDGIIRNVIESGAITALVASLELITYLVLPKTTVFFVFEFSLGKLYGNVLLATLHGMHRQEKSVYTNQELSDFPSHPRAFNIHSRSGQSDTITTLTPTAIQITTDIEVNDRGDQYGDSGSQKKKSDLL